ncbi:MAG: CoA transferase [Deltaproteobacteria bacterium]|nr:CoA transferase [Deltaproteobacteria bacterium]
MNDQALSGVKILEYCSTVTGAYTAKIMADMGAEVIKVEPPGKGDDARRHPPFAGDIPHPEKSTLFLFLNSNKLGVTLDVRKDEGREIFRKLAGDADILVEDGPVGQMEETGLGYDVLKEWNPGLIMISITPYGRSGPYRDYKAYQLNLANTGGQAYLQPQPSVNLDRPPVKPGGHLTDYDSALMAAVAIVAAYYRKTMTGRGQFIEISKQEAILNMQRVDTLMFANAGGVLNRSGKLNPIPGGGVLPAKDGHVIISAPEDHQWDALMKFMGDPDWSKEDWCRDRFVRAENAAEQKKLISQWMTQYPKERIFHEGQAGKVPVASVSTPEDLADSEQLQVRGFWSEMDHPVVGKIKFPASPYRFSKTPWQMQRPAPMLGEHNEAIYNHRLGYDRAGLARLREEGII